MVGTEDLFWVSGSMEMGATVRTRRQFGSGWATAVRPSRDAPIKEQSAQRDRARNGTQNSGQL